MRAGDLYFGHFLVALGETRQWKPQGEPLQLKAISTIKRASLPVSPYGAIGSPCGGIRSSYGLF